MKYYLVILSVLVGCGDDKPEQTEQALQSSDTAPEVSQLDCSNSKIHGTWMDSGGFGANVSDDCTLTYKKCELVATMQVDKEFFVVLENGSGYHIDVTYTVKESLPGCTPVGTYDCDIGIATSVSPWTASMSCEGSESIFLHAI